MGHLILYVQSATRLGSPASSLVEAIRMTQVQPRSKKLHNINDRHANLITFATAGFGLAFIDFLAYLSGGFVMAGVFAAVVIVFLSIRAAFVASRRTSRPTEDEQP